MNRSTLLWTWSALVVAGATAISACQAIANLGTRTTDPLPPANSCALPTSGNGLVRFANLVPSATNVDLCVRASGTSDWGRPVLRDGGLDAVCQAGFLYKNVSAPFAVNAGTLDFEVIPAGGPCSQTATSQILGVTVGDHTKGQPVVSIVRAGGGTARVPEKLVALPELNTGSSTSNSLSLRIVNASPGGPPLILGVVQPAPDIDPANVALPVDTSFPAFNQPVPFAGVEPAGPTLLGGATEVDSSGYVTNFLPVAFDFGLTPQGSTKAIIAWYEPAGDFTKTIYAVGDPQNAAFPVIGLDCDDNATDASQPILASCVATKLSTLAFDTINPSLYGANAPYESAREGQNGIIVSSVAAEDADFLCMVETEDPTQNPLIVAAMKSAGLANIVNPTANLNTPPTDATGWNGKTFPATLANPPCGGDVPAADFQAVYQCMIQNCSTTNDATGIINGSTSCLSTHCTAEFLPFYNTYQQCFGCMIYNVTSLQTYSQMNTNCTTDTRYPLAFAGAATSTLASRYPFATKSDGTPDVDTFFLPSTGFRREIISARVQIDPTDAANTLDVYCGFLTSPLINSSIPYTGNYSEGTVYSDEPGSGLNGWRDEQNLQVQKLLGYVKTRSGTSSAVIMGDWHASVANVATGALADAGLKDTIGNQSEEVISGTQTGGVTLQGLAQAYTPAHVAGYDFLCQYCPSTEASGVPNPYNPTGNGNGGDDFTTTYVTGPSFTSASVTEEDITLTADTVQYLPGTPTALGPIGEYYGRRVRILRPQ